MKETVEIKYADNGIIVSYPDSDSICVFQTETDEGKKSAIEELGSLIWYRTVESEGCCKLDKEIREHCKANNCICSGVRVTIGFEPIYQQKNKQTIEKETERKLLVSRIKTPDGTILESVYAHDYQEHVDKNGELYFIDGGNDYKNTSANKIPAEDVSIYTDSPFEEIRANYKRGTFDKNGNRIWKPIAECSDEHLKNIMIYNQEHCPNTPKWYTDIILKEQEYRKEHGITIEDNWDGEDC